MANLLDQLIEDQNARGTRPASAAQIDPTVPRAQYVEPVRDTDYQRRFGTSMFDDARRIWEQGDQSPGRLRSQLRLDELTTLAAQRKFDLERSQAEAPIRDALQLAQLEHERASTAALGGEQRFRLRQDADTMHQVAGFADYMTQAPPVNSPFYAPYVLRGATKFPRMATTEWGKNVLGKIAQEHDTIAGLTANLPEGFDVDSVSLNKSGPTLTVKPQGSDRQLEAEAKSGYGLTLGQIRNPVDAKVGRIVVKKLEGGGESRSFQGDPTGDLVTVKDKEGKPVTLSVEEYVRFGGKFSPETEAARAKTAPANTTPIRVSTVEEANALPSGTTFITPNGKIKRKP